MQALKGIEAANAGQREARSVQALKGIEAADAAPSKRFSKSIPSRISKKRNRICDSFSGVTPVG